VDASKEVASLQPLVDGGHRVLFVVLGDGRVDDGEVAVERVSECAEGLHAGERGGEGGGLHGGAPDERVGRAGRNAEEEWSGIS
jgi:hypothetical protein